MKTRSIANQNKNLLWIAAGTAGLLMIPLIAMQFTSEVNWSPSDFIIMGILLFSTGLIFDLLTRKFSKHKVAVGIAVAISFLIIWVHLAVGIVDTWPLAGS